MAWFLEVHPSPGQSNGRNDNSSHNIGPEGMDLELGSPLPGSGNAGAVVNVMVVEDCRDILEGLRMLINGTTGYRCIGTFESVEQALAASCGEQPGVVLLGTGLPGLSGIDGIPLLQRRYPSCEVLMFSVYDDSDRIFGALCAGASGYLLRKTPPARLLESLREATEGGAPMSPEVARKVVRLFHEFQPPPRTSYNLTPHESRLLKLFVEGHSYRTAADELKVSINTVSFHMRRIYGKLQVHSKSEAVAKALRGGIFR